MRFQFSNDLHKTTATVTAKGWRISQRQVQRLWKILCCETDCDCEYGGLRGPNRWRLREVGNHLWHAGADIVQN